MSQVVDYLDWQSELELEQLFGAAEPLSYPELCDLESAAGYLYLSRCKEDGRSVLMFQADAAHASPQCLTPAPFSLRTRISEYGGKPYWRFAEQVIFCNDADQCLYRFSLAAAVNNAATLPTRITALPQDLDQPLIAYTDLVQLSDAHFILILERASPQPSSSLHRLATINLAQANAKAIDLPPQADFFNNLCVDVERQRIAWVQWDHPQMPWDETELWLADYQLLDDEIILSRTRRVQLEPGASVCQLLLAANGRLFFSADFTGYEPTEPKNYWNIYALDPALLEPKISAVTHELSEFGYPHWQYGDHRLVQFSATHLLTYATDALGDTVFLIDQQSLQIHPLDCGQLTLQHLSANAQGQAIAVCCYANKQPSIALLSDASEGFAPSREPAPVLAQQEVSLAEHCSYQSTAGGQAFGYYYAPKNSNYRSPSPPPLLVMVHGGPTAKAYGYFDLQKQFWTQRGFAIVDVNHRGSSGYGRAFRDSLYGHWGVHDADDIVAAVAYLVAVGKADPKRVCIRGKSAGGYAVLRALTEHPQTFKAGASYYGIGNLATLAETTHKFEKHYTDRLTGEVFQSAQAQLASSAYFQRSPINKLDGLQSAMIIFQGLLDKVVPPALADEIIATLQSHNIPHSYVKYPDEGHGFRSLDNNIDAWTRELNFYREYLADEHH